MLRTLRSTLFGAVLLAAGCSGGTDQALLVRAPEDWYPTTGELKGWSLAIIRGAEGPAGFRGRRAA
jgi:hypothetical protein